MKKKYLYSLLALAVSTACQAETFPDPVGPSQSDFGGVGLLQTPNARRQADFSARQRELGRRQRPMWLTDDEFEKLKSYLEKLRS